MEELIQKIIAFVMELLGLKKKPEQPELAAGDSPARTSSPAAQADAEEEEEAKEEEAPSGYQVLLKRDGAELWFDEEDQEKRWIDKVSKEIPRASWADEWGPAGKGADDDTLVTFLHHKLVFEMECQSDPESAEKKLQGFGYRDAGHYYKVYTTVLKHFADFSGPNLDDGVFSSQRFMSASMKATQLMHRGNMAAAQAADPTLTAPFEGTTMEQYAQLQAQLIHLSPADQTALLAKSGFDAAKWQRVSNEWNDRMSKDMTHTLTTIYGQAFTGAGAGQFGKAAAAHSATGFDGTAAGGEAPLPFEKTCEIQGAMQAWSKTGQDVNALLNKTFKMNAADFSAVHSWWLSQLTADVARFPEYTRLTGEAEEKYSAGAPAKPDADLSF